MGRETVAWNQKVSSWGLTTQPWTPSQAEARLLVRKEGRRGRKEGDKWRSCKNQILLSSRGRIYFYTGCCCSSPTTLPPTPKAVFSIENHVVDGWSCGGIIRETERRGCLLLLLLFCQRGLVGIHKVEDVGYLWYLSLMREHHSVSGS